MTGTRDPAQTCASADDGTGDDDPFDCELADLDDLAAELRGAIAERHPVDDITNTAMRLAQRAFSVAFMAGRLHELGDWPHREGVR